MGIPKPLVQTNQIFMVLSVLVGILFHHAWLWLPFLIGVYTLLTKLNPIILFSKRFLSKPSNQYIQEDKDQQIFNQWIATICLGLALLSFYFNWTAAGYAFSIMVMLAAGIALMGFCIGCFIRYQFIMWRHRRTTRS
jgi:membrane-associated HD superfamily phosphohydrolase